MEKFFKVKIKELTLDPNSGKQKKTTYSVLVRAEDVDKASEKTKEKEFGGEWEIASISDSGISEVWD